MRSFPCAGERPAVAAFPALFRVDVHFDEFLSSVPHSPHKYKMRPAQISGAFFTRISSICQIRAGNIRQNAEKHRQPSKGKPAGPGPDKTPVLRVVRSGGIFGRKSKSSPQRSPAAPAGLPKPSRQGVSPYRARSLRACPQSCRTSSRGCSTCTPSPKPCTHASISARSAKSCSNRRRPSGSWL